MPDWSRRLPAPIKAGRRQLRTLHDLRDYILALPRERQDFKTWSYAGSLLVLAAEGKESVESAVVAFRLARMQDPKLPT
jgi:hypothetical protein